MRSMIAAILTMSALAAGCVARPMNLVPPDLGLLIDVKEPVNDKAIQDAFFSRPGVKPGANVAVAFIQSDKRFKFPITVGPEDRKAWDTALKDGFFVSDVVILSSIYAHSTGVRDVRVLRKSAATLNCDLLVVYSVSYDFARNPNVLSCLYLTIIGCFIVPGDSVMVGAIAKVAVLDVRTGYVYGVVDGACERHLAMPVGWLPADMPRIFNAASTEALTKAR